MNLLYYSKNGTIFKKRMYNNFVSRTFSKYTICFHVFTMAYCVPQMPYDRDVDVC